MSIRAIGFTPNYTSHNQNKNAVSFGRETVDKDKPYYTTSEMKSLAGATACTGWGIGCLMGVLAVSAMNECENNKMYENMVKLKNYIESDDIVKDRFEIKDVTGDEKPDMVLFKKDGSKVVLDVAEGKLKEEVTTLKEVK